MTLLFARFVRRLPSGYWSGLGFGLVAFVLAATVLTLLYWGIRPFVWAAIYGVPYISPVGPFPMFSGEWFFVQGIWFLSACVLVAPAAGLHLALDSHCCKFLGHGCPLALGLFLGSLAFLLLELLAHLFLAQFLQLGHLGQRRRLLGVDAQAGGVAGDALL